MKTITIQLSARLAAKLSADTRAHGVTPSHIIRKLLDRHYGTPRQKRHRTFAESARGLIGTSSGPGDLSTHPQYLKGYS